MERERSKLFLLDYPTKGEQLNITLDVDNWQDWEVSANRDGFSDTFIETSFPFHFVRGAREAIKSLFDKYGVSAFATVRLIPYDDAMPSGSEPYNYAEAIDYDLDFMSYREKNTTIEINVRTKDLRSLLKEQEGTVYDFEVYRIRERRPYVFRRLTLDNFVRLHYQDVVSYDNSYSGYKRLGWYPGSNHDFVGGMWTMNMNVIKADVVVKDYIMAQEVSGGTSLFLEESELELDDLWTLKILQAGEYNFKFNQTAYCPMLAIQTFDPQTNRDALIDIINNPLYTPGVDFICMKLPRTGSSPSSGRLVIGKTVMLHAEPHPTDPYIILCYPSFYGNMMYGRDDWVSAGGTSSNRTFSFDSGDKLAFFVRLKMDKAILTTFTAVANFSLCCIDEIEVSYRATNDVVTVDWIDPKTLLQVLVDRMTRTTGKYKTEIEFVNEWDSDVYRLGIVAAESLRGYPKAMLHTSYRNFRQWMLSLGYLECETEDGITYRRVTEDTVFNPAIEPENVLQLNEVSDLNIYPTSKILYSNIKVGYKEVKVETINGNYEYNGEAQYEIVGATGKQTLDLTSPYRADCIGMELLVPYRKDEFETDSRADNDVFVVDMMYLDNGQAYTEVKAAISGVVNPGQIDLTGRGWFNARLSPYMLMRRWSEVLLGFGGSLRLASSTNLVNTRLLIYDLDSTIFITSGALRPTTYDFATGNKLLISQMKRNNLVGFTYNGEKFYGYIEDIRQNPLWNTEVQWKLQKYSVEPRAIIYQLYAEENVVVDFYQNEVNIRIFANGYTVMPALTIGTLPSWITYISQTAGSSYVDVKFIVSAQTNVIPFSPRNAVVEFTDLIENVSCTVDISQEEYRVFDVSNILQYPQVIEFSSSTEMQNRNVLLMFFADIFGSVIDVSKLIIVERLGVQTELIFSSFGLVAWQVYAPIVVCSIDNVTEKGKTLIRIIYLGRNTKGIFSVPSPLPTYTANKELKLQSNIDVINPYILPITMSDN